MKENIIKTKQWRLFVVVIVVTTWGTTMILEGAGTLSSSSSGGLSPIFKKLMMQTAPAASAADVGTATVATGDVSTNITSSAKSTTPTIIGKGAAEGTARNFTPNLQILQEDNEKYIAFIRVSDQDIKTGDIISGISKSSNPQKSVVGNTTLPKDTILNEGVVQGVSKSSTSGNKTITVWFPKNKTSTSQVTALATTEKVAGGAGVIQGTAGSTAAQAETSTALTTPAATAADEGAATVANAGEKATPPLKLYELGASGEPPTPIPMDKLPSIDPNSTFFKKVPLDPTNTAPEAPVKWVKASPDDISKAKSAAAASAKASATTAAETAPDIATAQDAIKAYENKTGPASDIDKAIKAGGFQDNIEYFGDTREWTITKDGKVMFKAIADSKGNTEFILPAPEPASGAGDATKLTAGAGDAGKLASGTTSAATVGAEAGADIAQVSMMDTAKSMGAVALERAAPALEVAAKVAGPAGAVLAVGGGALGGSMAAGQENGTMGDRTWNITGPDGTNQYYIKMIN